MMMAMSNDRNPTKPTLAVSILHFNAEEHRFSADIHIEATEETQDTLQSNAPDAMITWKPSDSWMSAYREWNHFGENGIPSFENAQALSDFNKIGLRLEKELRLEVSESEADHQPGSAFHVQVQPFVPLYSAIEVGGASSWWHLRDSKYRGLIIPIQYLPVSDELKSRLQAWRMRVGKVSFRNDLRREYDEEGQCLEREILAELRSSAPLSSRIRESFAAPSSSISSSLGVTRTGFAAPSSSISSSLGVTSTGSQSFCGTGQPNFTFMDIELTAGNSNHPGLPVEL